MLNVPPRPDLALAIHDTGFFGHPRGLATLFFTEMWERFSYYGGRAMLFLYMTYLATDGGLEFDATEAGALFGLYTALVYMTNLPGGWIADKFLGARNAVFWGGVIIALGNASIALGGLTMFYVGLALIAMGTGLLKPNVSTMVGSLYSKDDPRRDAAFSIFYMGINLGATLAPILCGWLAQSDAFKGILAGWGIDPATSWRWGFGAVAVGMILGLIQYRLGAKYLGTAGVRQQTHTSAEKAQQKRSLLLGVGVVAALVLLPVVVDMAGLADVSVEWIRNMVGVLLLIMPIAYFGVLFTTGKWTRDERGRIVAIIIFYIAAALFWGSFEQAGSTLTLFADRLTRNAIFGWEFPSVWWQSVNGIFIILLAPVFAGIWLTLARRRKEPSTPVKFGLGLFFVGLGFLLLVVPAMTFAGADVSGDVPAAARVGPQWLLTLYLIHTIGELCLSPVGLSAMTKLAPERIVGQMMGIWFLGAATGNFIGGNIGGLFETFPLHQIFMAVFGTSALAALLMFVLAPWIRRLMSGVK